MRSVHAGDVEVGSNRFVARIDGHIAAETVSLTRGLLLGILMFLAGFVLWNVDNLFCHHLTASKKQMLLPWSLVLETHGWWHILTGLGE